MRPCRLPILAWTFACLTTLAAGSEETKRVLLLHGGEKDTPANEVMDRIIRARLKEGAGRPVEIYTEYLDVSRFPDKKYQQLNSHYLREKYAGRRIDLVVSIFGYMVESLRSQQEDGAQIFPSSTMIICGVDERTPGHAGPEPETAQTLRVFVFKDTLNAALRMHPGARRVVVVGGTYDGDKSVEAKAREELKEFEGRVDFTYLTNHSIEEILGEVGNLPPQTIILYLQMFRDGAGKHFYPKDALVLIARAANAPVYSLSDTFLGTGTIGGYVYSYEANAEKAAELALRVLNGDRSLQAPLIANGVIAPVFDWRQLKRFGVSEASLPPGSIVRYREPSFWDLYKWRIIGAASLCFIEALLILALLIQRAKRKRAEKGRRFLAAIVESSTDAIIGLNLDRKIVSWNPGAVKLFGHSAREAVGRDISMLVPSDRHREMESILGQVRSGGMVEQIETARRRKDGSMVDVSISAAPIQNERGEIAGAAAIIRDITKRKQAEEALRKAQAELVHVDRVAALGELAASIAHEVNQPLAAIVGNADLCLNWLASERPNLEEAREALADILQDGNRASQVLARIRTLIKKGAPQKASLGINEVIGEVVALVSHEAARREVRIETELGVNLPPVLGDRVQLEQVLLNLIMNGLDAAHMMADSDRKIVIRSSEDSAGGVLVAVQDSGPGIEPKDLEQIFAAFYTTKPEGLGMGLAICRSIINDHGGQLCAVANDGRGATFQFALPAYSKKVA
jgi:PAS domain S-box-containing protein